MTIILTAPDNSIKPNGRASTDTVPKKARQHRAEEGAGGLGPFPGLRGRAVELPAYSGPLDLLLKLIQKHEVDIYDIPIATLTDQYLAELGAMEKRDMVVAGDFLLLAATLIEIKSAMLLPRPAVIAGEEGEDPRAELVQRLLEYQAFQSAAEELAGLARQRQMLFSRQYDSGVMEEFGRAFPAAPNLNLESLRRSLARMLARLEGGEEPVTTLPRQKISLQLRITELLAELTAAGRNGLDFGVIARAYEGRLFVIITFLAILELLRSGRIRMEESSGVENPRFWVSRRSVQTAEQP